jgi:signal transduction histidine kinase
MSENLQFKISSALKDIVGRDLITNDYVAVFELVKNAFDAHATKVYINFENIYTKDAMIIIQDNGKGMNYDELIDKWLFLAYSAKKEGTEDEDFDYRDKIYANKPFAGAKGIGRFSCDKLGKQLYLETKKLEKNANTEILITDWEKFEKDSKNEFINISVLHDTENKPNYNIKNGTVLEITGLRSKWDRTRLLELKDSLSKLINPHDIKNSPDFSIIINVPEEMDADRNEKEYRNILNGKVNNFIFEDLGLKTTKIICSLDVNGEFINTKLFDGGTAIYQIKQINKYNLLQEIDITLFYLNRSAKYTFAKRMGVASRIYGNVFLYKNGFRVFPYGEPNSDPMGIDKRKSRKTKSLLGTGEIMGRVEIHGEANTELKEASSRGDGLSKNEYYFQLVSLFFDVLKKLETYVVDVQKWGISIEDEDNLPLSSRIIDMLSIVTNSDDIIDFSVPDNFLEIIELSQADSAETVVNNLKKIAITIGDNKLLEITDKAVEKVKILQEAREEAKKEAEEAQKKALEATQKLKSKITENLFLKSINTADYEEMISLLHHVGIYAGTIENNLKGISLRIQNNIPLSNDELYNIMKQIGLDVKKISNIVIFATKAKFNLESDVITLDLINYIKEYIENIIPSVIDKKMSVQYIDLTNTNFITELKPIELNIIIDNLISNARKAKSTKLIVQTIINVDSNLTIEFIDNGVGIQPENLSEIFNLGFTTTDGSGIGLYHVKEIINNLKANIRVEHNSMGGVTFKIIFKEKK